MKALLGNHGVGDCWSDQPAGLNYLHVILFHLSSPSLEVLRGTSFGFTVVLLASLLAVTHKAVGWLAACGTAFVFLSSRGFLQLSVATLIGLPAYALALASTACLVIGAVVRPSIWLPASGAVLALGAHIKLSALLVLPALLLWLGSMARFELAPGWQNRRALRIWLVWFVGVFLLPWLLNPENFWLILSAHWGADTRNAFATDTAPYVHIGHLLAESYFLSGPALLGLLGCVVLRRREGFIPSVWLITAFGVHLWHRPFWQFHFLHLSVPMAWLAGLFFGEMVRQFKAVTWEGLIGKAENPRVPSFSLGEGEGERKAGEGEGKGAFWRSRRFSQVAAWLWVLPPSLFLSAFLVEMPGRWAKETAFLRVDDSKDWECVAVMKEYKRQTKWVFADNALYPFHAGMLTPPEIAVLSAKRLRAGLITQPELLNLLVHYRAEQVLVRRHVFDEKFMRYVEQHYTQVFEQGSLQLFIRDDLVKQQLKGAKSTQTASTASPAGRGKAL